jgi:PKD repeat protein
LHAYAAGGSYTVTLTVTDNDGAMDSATATADIVVDSADDVAAIVDDPIEIPDSSFSDMGVGHRTGTSSILAVVQKDITAGRIRQATKKLNILKAHLDGCDGSMTESPDHNDWVINCDDQRRIRALIEDLLAYLGSLP